MELTARIELASESALARFLQVCPGSDLAHELPPGRTDHAPAPWSLTHLRRSAPKCASLIFAICPLYQTLRGDRHRLSGKSQIIVGFCCFNRIFAELRLTRTCHLYPVHSRRNRSAPLISVFYFLLRLSLKNFCISSRQSFSKTPDVTLHLWFNRLSFVILKSESQAPAFLSLAPYTTSFTLAHSMAPAHMGHGSIVTNILQSVKR